jgi:hypothetical protein
MFWSKEAYKIAEKITGGHELSCDLVSHVYIILSRYTIPEDEIPRTFAKFAYNQWRWRESEFNKSMRAFNHSEIDDIIQSEDTSPSIEQNLFRDYLEKPSEDDNELFCKEIAKMYICGMTYREIRSHTGIELHVINKAIKQFKHDVLNTINSSRDLQSHYDSSPSRLEAI